MYVGYTLGPVVYDYDVTFAGAAPYGQVEFSPATRLRASVGLRYDHIQYVYDDTVTAPPSSRYRRPDDTTRRYEQASPKAGLTFQASERVNVFASYRRAFRVPSEGQLFRQGSTRNTVDLKPVRADSVEVGLRATPVKALSIQVSAYRLEKRDDILAYRNPLDGYTDSVNAGQTRHQGVEVGADAALAGWLRLSLAWSATRHSYRSWAIDPQRGIDYSGREMEAAPRGIGSASITVLPRAGIMLSGEVNALGRYWMDAANTAKYGGHALFNLRGQVAVAGGLVVFARVTNVGDRRFAESASYTTLRGPELAPGRPRALYVGIEARWRR